MIATPTDEASTGKKKIVRKTGRARSIHRFDHRGERKRDQKVQRDDEEGEQERHLDRRVELPHVQGASEAKSNISR